MTNHTKSQLLEHTAVILTKLFMKYEVIRHRPIVMTDGSKLYATQAHVLEAIAKGFCKTVTGLTVHFKVTKGASSQVVKKLCESGYISKEKRSGNNKEVILKLTKKGCTAVRLHDQLGQTARDELIHVGNSYSKEQLGIFVEMMEKLDSCIGEIINKDGQYEI